MTTSLSSLLHAEPGTGGRLPEEDSIDFVESLRADVEAGVAYRISDEGQFVEDEVEPAPEDYPALEPGTSTNVPNTPQPLSVMRNVSKSSRILLDRNQDAERDAVAAVEWVCNTLYNEVEQTTMLIDMPIGEMDFPVIAWREEGTLLTVVLRKEHIGFTPKYGSDLEIRITSNETSKEFSVVYGGGLLRIDGLPIVIISFLIHNPTHGEDSTT